MILAHPHERRRTRWQLTALAAVVALLAGCSLTPTYQRPSAPVAPQWSDSAGPLAASAQESRTQAADLPWQEFVREQELREIIQLALENNRDLQIALHNIEQARAQYQIRRADQVPNLGLNASASRSEPGPAAAMGGPKVGSSYTVGLGVAGWELDFFGRVAALKDVALANFLATTEARKAVQVSLVSSVITTWLQLKTDTELMALAERTLASRRQSLQLIQLRVDHGVSSELDLRQAQSLVFAADATHAEQKRLRGQDINLLTMLVGAQLPERLLPPVPHSTPPRPPADLSEPTAAVEPVAALPEFAPVPVGLPSDLLLYRPDIRAVEQQLVAANANIGAARANFFPRITLTGNLGRISSDLDGLLGSGGQKSWSFGPSLTLPIFDAGRNQANLEASEAMRKAAVAEYEKAIQAAFREVADALVARTAYAEQLDALRAQADVERDRFRLADLRYRNGIANFLDMLDAQRSLFGVEQALAQIQLAQRASTVQLYKALGGGWTEPSGTPEPARPAPTETAAAQATL